MNKRADRLERTIKNVLAKKRDAFPHTHCLNPADVLKLLRRERARLKRKVKALRDGPDSYGEFYRALDYVLRLLEE